MPRDYAKRSKKRPKPLPGWVWMLGGLFIGLLVALLVYLDKQPHVETPSFSEVVEDLKAKTETATRELATRTREKSAENKDKTADSKKTGPRFDFYHILPELEVTVPDDELAKAEKREKAKQPTARYLLQAGSFREYKEADRLKASLALLGLEARIQTVTINKKDTWHRVRVGPYDSARALSKARRRLQDNGIQPIVLKITS